MKRRPRRNYNKLWTHEKIKDAVQDSISYSEVIKKLTGEPKANSHQWKTLRRLIEEYEIDVSHFPNFSQRVKQGALRSHGRASNEDLFCLDSPFGRETIRRRYFELYGDQGCKICEIKTWMERPLMLQIDHINGVNSDWRLDNLRWLCPNCHSQTPTFCRGHKRADETQLCLSEVDERVRESSMRAVARELNMEPLTLKRKLFYGGIEGYT